MASPPAAPRSDGEYELGEGSREPVPEIDVGGQFLVATASVLDENVPGAESPVLKEPFQTTHGPQRGLQRL
jgi:hypothetical protein